MSCVLTDDGMWTFRTGGRYYLYDTIKGIFLGNEKGTTVGDAFSELGSIYGNKEPYSMFTDKFNETIFVFRVDLIRAFLCAMDTGLTIHMDKVSKTYWNRFITYQDEVTLDNDVAMVALNDYFVNYTQILEEEKYEIY